MRLRTTNFILVGMAFLFLSCQPISEKVSVSIEHPVLPVLSMKETNPVMRLQFVKNNLAECTLDGITFSLEGTTNTADISSVRLYRTDSKGRFKTDDLLAEASLKDGKAVFHNKIVFISDTLTCWLAVGLQDKVNLTNRIQLSCQQIETSDGLVTLPKSTVQKEPLRVGVAIRQHKQDGVHTSRIPGLATSKKGTLLAVYDARYENSRDLQGHMDIGLNRSFDGGMTWQSMQVTLDMKEWGGLPEKFNGVSDACILVDDKTGDIYIAGLWMHGVFDVKTGEWKTGLTADSKVWNHQWRGKGSQPGLGVKETCQFLISKSTDDGETWSEPINITQATKRKEWWLYAPAPGHGITLKDGTLVFPTQGRDKNGLPFSNITYSKDGGKNWITSNPAYTDVTECMAVELADGSIMLNMRDNRNRKREGDNGRRICVTKDLGETWVEHPSSHKVLTEPVCMACLHRHGDLLLFSNPNSRTARKNMTIKLSTDDGASWPEKYHLLLDEYSGRGYSCMTSVNDSIIGILYEGSQSDMVYQQILIKDLFTKSAN